MSGSLRRNVLTFEDFKQIRTGTNHRRGPFHHRAPTKIFQRAIRGMINYKHTKGITALDRIQVNIFLSFCLLFPMLIICCLFFFSQSSNESIPIENIKQKNLKNQIQNNISMKSMKIHN